MAFVGKVENVVASKQTTKGDTWNKFKKQWELQLMVIPAIIFIFIFSYVPMYGILMAFQEYDLGDIPGLSTWVGMFQFELFFTDPMFKTVFTNTIAISLLKLAIGFPAPIILALMLNEVRGAKIKKFVQTASYLPHFISWVVAAGLLFDLLSVDGGTVNSVLMGLGIVKEPIFFLGEAKYFWGLTVLSDIWKEVGWGSIIYIAAITSIDEELYEAAELDGAGRFQKIWFITLASIKPTIVILFIFAVGGLLGANFDQIMMLTNSMNNAMLIDKADVIDTYVYRMGIVGGRFSYGAAAGLFKNIINFGLLIMANKIADKVGSSSVW
jgi:putative aldouronate transport system permease protein